MGNLCANSPKSDEEKEAAANSRNINKRMMKDYEKAEEELKLLLLGAGESGKSTIFKQMKIINKNGYSEEERRRFIGIIHNNTIACIKTLIEACQETLADPPVISPECKPLATSIFDLNNTETLNPKLAEDIETLWKSQAIQDAYTRASEYQLPDSAQYYLSKVKELAESSYMPDEQDVLRSRVRTTGIVETSWTSSDTGGKHQAKFRMFDVGGQRNERRKWIHCFDNVTAVIFVASLSEYDQVLYEDDQQNRMGEALNLFEQICNTRWFEETPMILFLNKVDLFEEKIKRVQLSEYFEEYKLKEGDSVVDSGINFISNKFVSLVPSRQNSGSASTVYVHITCATDTGTMRFVFDAVKDIMIHANLQLSGF